MEGLWEPCPLLLSPVAAAIQAPALCIPAAVLPPAPTALPLPPRWAQAPLRPLQPRRSGPAPWSAGQSSPQGCAFQRRSPSGPWPSYAAGRTPRPPAPAPRRLPRCSSSLVSVCFTLGCSGSPFLMEIVLCVTELTLGLDTCIS